MKKIFIIEDSLENKISYYHLGLFLVLLPFNRFYSEIVLISLSLHTLIHINPSRLRKIASRQNLILCSVVFVGLAGLIYSHDRSQGFRDLQMQSAIILFPCILSATGLNLRRYRESLLCLFASACVLVILYLFGDALHIIVYNKLPLSSIFSQAFLNHNFSDPIGIHATYLSMYTALSFAFMLYRLLAEKKINYRVIFLSLAVAVLMAGLAQLASRSVLIATITFTAVGFPLFMHKGRKRLWFIIIMLIVSGIVALSITKIDSFKRRYVAEFKDDLTQSSINNEILEPRLVRWHYVLQVIRKAPVLGHGSGSEKRLLQDKYFAVKLYNSYLNELNAHNEYLSIVLKTGLWGLVIFLFTLAYGFAGAWLRRDIIFTAFLFLVCIVSFSENVLDVNKGIFFYAFFFSFFAKSGKPFTELHRFITRKDP